MNIQSELAGHRALRAVYGQQNRRDPTIRSTAEANLVAATASV